ncbi:MAG: helix-turn-helix transcriptional regulator [Firmicutes bacterium]|nr:helix-turn-helix transcriptional regulator [Bacillota bacterium]
MVINMFNVKLLTIREENDLTQKEVADVLGVKQAVYSRWENKVEIIPLPKLINFCNYFNLSLDYICGFSNNKNINLNSNMIDRKTIGNNIVKFRNDNNLSQKDLAKFLNTTPSTVCAYEKGKTLILTSFAYQICEKYNISMDWLCGRTK